MKMLTLTTLLVLILASTFVAAASPKKDILPISSRFTSVEQFRELRRLAQGCNANIGFAIDGSISISREDFEAQLTFVQNLAFILGIESVVELAAVQYGNRASRISRLTVDRNGFGISLLRTRQLKSRTSSVARGINFCMRQLQRRSGEANEIVVLGDDRSTIGPNAVRRADLFRSLGGEVCTVGAGFTDDSELLAIADGDPEKVFQVDNFVVDIDICGDTAEVSGAPTARELLENLLIISNNLRKVSELI